MSKVLKVAAQIAVILLAIAVIGGGIYMLVTHTSMFTAMAGGFDSGRHLPGGFNGIRPGDGFGGRSFEGRGFDGRDGRTGFNLGFGLIGVGRILVEIGVVVLAVLLIQWLIRRARRPKAAVAAATASQPAASKVMDVTPPTVEEPSTPTKPDEDITLPGEEPKK